METKTEVLEGVIQKFDPVLSYGFISGPKGDRYFFHRKDLLTPPVRTGMQVSFTLDTYNGRTCAVNVSKI